jgi:hypothetical protein
VILSWRGVFVSPGKQSEILRSRLPLRTAGLFKRWKFFWLLPGINSSAPTRKPTVNFSASTSLALTRLALF